MNETERTEWELGSAAWRTERKEMIDKDIPNYDLLADSCGITRHEAMLLNGLSILTVIRNLLVDLTPMVADFHRREFPERWKPCDEQGKPE